MSKPELRELLSQLWEKHLRAPFPPHMRGQVIEGEDMVLLDAGIAGCVSSSLSGSLEGERRQILLNCLADVENVLPLIDDGAGAKYYEHLRLMAMVAVELGTVGAQ
ncbi:hypothetical protein [Streptomyces sp. NBC_00859]|uniref:hypothetical protein n=1 Tax=Streptomyces sp. NBC_00859 TaxID=2903682 RepID=UPI003864A446|nr:hypothetical protein OG584_33805 [Streptomyces sp. NBC_00859]